MPNIGAVELLVLAVALVVVVAGLAAVVVAVRIGSDRRRASRADRMPDAWLEQHAVADPPPDPTERP